jgi:hypothetical protein
MVFLYRADQIEAVVDYDFAQDTGAALRYRLRDAERGAAPEGWVSTQRRRIDFDSMPWEYIAHLARSITMRQTHSAAVGLRTGVSFPRSLLRVLLVTDRGTCATQEDPESI